MKARPKIDMKLNVLILMKVGVQNQDDIKFSSNLLLGTWKLHTAVWIQEKSRKELDVERFVQEWGLVSHMLQLKNMM